FISARLTETLAFLGERLRQPGRDERAHLLVVRLPVALVRRLAKDPVHLEVVPVRLAKGVDPVDPRSDRQEDENGDDGDAARPAHAPTVTRRGWGSRNRTAGARAWAEVSGPPERVARSGSRSGRRPASRDC